MKIEDLEEFEAGQHSFPVGFLTAKTPRTPGIKATTPQAPCIQG
jgi:hypothetical protein